MLCHSVIMVIYTRLGIIITRSRRGAYEKEHDHAMVVSCLGGIMTWWFHANVVSCHGGIRLKG